LSSWDIIGYIIKEGNACTIYVNNTQVLDEWKIMSKSLSFHLGPGVQRAEMGEFTLLNVQNTN